MRGYTYLGFRSKLESMGKANTLNSNTRLDAFKMLNAGRAEFVLDYKFPVENKIKKSKTIQNIFDINNLRSKTISENFLYFILSKKYPDAKNFMIKVEKSFDELNKAGRFESYLNELNPKVLNGKDV